MSTNEHSIRVVEAGAVDLNETKMRPAETHYVTFRCDAATARIFAAHIDLWKTVAMDFAPFMAKGGK